MSYPAFYPIECPHGYDCCPECDAEVLAEDAASRRREASERAERFVDPYRGDRQDMAESEYGATEGGDADG